jgi:hypothetical protein
MKMVWGVGFEIKRSKYIFQFEAQIFENVFKNLYSPLNIVLYFCCKLVAEQLKIYF